ncbi:hypothetical protein B0T18DRAFT_445185 [Schizothecium vesticola]|uniref:Uncharacterized protein n=1 Tax=Schizothecium vesticola TaxID=314040 RepID=A0AA40F1F3_9PEZI|nr:hypothetical protein B0T18DRAFT_445185 [Schizothecium vesticola]
MSGNSNAASEATRIEEGKPNSHIVTDSKDQRTIANRLAAAESATEPRQDKETEMGKKDPTAPAKMHGNEPSRGAEIDAEIQAEEEQILKKKGASLPDEKN